MDVPRIGARRNKIIRRTIAAVILVCAIPLITWGLSRLKPAAPTVELATVWPDTVKRGPMIRQVRGLGTLVPEDVLWIPADSDGRVERIYVRPGAQVKPDTILIELSNPDLELSANDLEWQVKAAEAAYTDLRVRLESQKLDQQANTARVQSEYVQAKLKADLEEQLRKEGLTSELNQKLTRATADELANRHELEKKRLEISSESIEAQLAAQRVQIQKLRAQYELKKTQVVQLKVRAGTAGVLQQLGIDQTHPIEVGQRVTPGTILAKIAQPWKLKAELKIPETQAKDILIGQLAEIDTRNGIIRGRASRIDPAVQNGTVTVDVRLEGELPAGARPDLSVDGTIELERLNDVIYVGRPVFGQQNSTVSLFRIDSSGKEAQRVQVKFGRTSVNTIEVLEGLRVGDRVILSDMS
ncbi:MAG: efflux RND transporter periplasmic adaptor subunit, partial [Acidobacteria bacterium]|nr:efflux RND transporter periplasmic adaptor subunit [Acidobacteriota bacterium]